MKTETQIRLLEKVNELTAKTTGIGVDELEDVIDLIFEIFEEAEKEGRMVDNLLSLALELGKPLGAAIVGIDDAWLQAMDLTESEIDSLVERASSYSLGSQAVKAKAVVKFLLTGLYTFSLFKEERV